MTPAVAAVRPRVTMIHSDLLGPLAIAPDEMVIFPDGLLGFPECRNFALVPAAAEGVYWLQSLEFSALAFLLVDPFIFFDGYALEVNDAVGAELGAESPADLAVLAIVTLPREEGDVPTANLQGPLVLNPHERLARQVVIPEPDKGVRSPIDPERLRG